MDFKTFERIKKLGPPAVKSEVAAHRPSGGAEALGMHDSNKDRFYTLWRWAMSGYQQSNYKKLGSDYNSSLRGLKVFERIVPIAQDGSWVRLYAEKSTKGLGMPIAVGAEWYGPDDFEPRVTERIDCAPNGLKGGVSSGPIDLLEETRAELAPIEANVT